MNIWKYRYVDRKIDIYRVRQIDRYDRQIAKYVAEKFYKIIDIQIDRKTEILIDRDKERQKYRKIEIQEDKDRQLRIFR